MPSYKWVALSEPQPGRERELEDWYDTQHLPDCLKLDGFVSAQRFRVDQKPVGIDVPAWKVMVIYDIESDDIEATLAQIPKVIRTPAMPMTDHIDLRTALRVLGKSTVPPLTKK